ncbi:DUF3883 domain-containing protein [Larsenimonas suaedae]|uniref:DUF3883 domain-containing protein n=1 Tax=Larsenimonas suaedae TaxID=1851019 RepID=A0ABU1GXF9_9GAMM|nr:DUF3883 domain-containing protein [Larsenimonas suaedae]MCM2973329.1 DUF3883 domain-containing protein [Larsenimonas suaedae]MDR5896222.1 DUF3883 domain-containing protein [Larsenimonas suaedae]
MSRPTPWSDAEVEATVITYREMLIAELSGQRYTKSKLNEKLIEKLEGRSKGAIEFKHSNISAVLRDADCPYVEGYKPRSNYQQSLVEAVERYLLSTELFDRAARSATDRPVIDAMHTVDERMIVEPPETSPPQTRVKEAGAAYTVRTPQKRDYLARERRNRELGLAGEQLVVRLEKHRLTQAGQGALAERVEHVAVTQGDGLGFDVRSFDANGDERLIEVKTTAFAKETPFFITPNELECARDNAEHYHLFRLFNFRKNPRLFCLKGDLYGQLWLEPDSYRAGVR